MALTRGSLGINIDPSYNDMKDAFELAMLADTVGFDFVGVQDHLYHPAFLDAWTLLTYLAATTERITVMTNVATIALRPPAPLIKAASTLSLLSGGRVALGVGAGAMAEGIAAYGGDAWTQRERIDAFEEALEVMRALRDPEIRAANVEGRYFQVRGAHPGPLPPALVPLLVGSYGPRMLALTGRLSDGWLPTNAYAPPSKIPAMQAIIDEAALKAGRVPSDVLRVYNVMGSITDGRGGLARDDEAKVVGPAQYWIDTLEGYRDELGFDAFMFWPTEGDPLEQATLFGEQVLPEILKRTPKTTR